MVNYFLSFLFYSHGLCPYRPSVLFLFLLPRSVSSQTFLIHSFLKFVFLTDLDVFSSLITVFINKKASEDVDPQRPYELILYLAHSLRT